MSGILTEVRKSGCRVMNKRQPAFLHSALRTPHSSLPQKFFREDVAAAEDAGGVEGAFEFGHLAQVSLAVERAKVFALYLADPVLGGDGAAERDGALYEARVGLARRRPLDVVAREYVDVNVVVAYVAEDDVREARRAQAVLVEAEHLGERRVGHGHVGRDLPLAVAREPLVDHHGQRVPEGAHLRAVVLVRPEPGLVGERAVAF